MTGYFTVYAGIVKYYKPKLELISNGSTLSTSAGRKDMVARLIGVVDRLVSGMHVEREDGFCMKMDDGGSVEKVGTRDLAVTGNK